MIDCSISQEKSYYIDTLLQTFQSTVRSFNCNRIYLQSKTISIIYKYITKQDIYGSGLTSVLTKNDLKEQVFENIIILAVLDTKEAFQQIEKYLHLFNSIFVINLVITTKQTSRLMKLSPLRAKIKGIKELSFNFVPYIDNVYEVNTKQVANQLQNFSAFSSYLVSFKSVFQYQISFDTNSKDKQFLESFTSFQSNLNQKLQILQRHESPNFTQMKSPRIKVLFIDRSKDELSPLAYSYFFGSMAEEFQMQNKQEIIKSPLFNALYQLNIQQSIEFLEKNLKNRKMNEQKDKQIDIIDKAKKLIANSSRKRVTQSQIEDFMNKLGKIKDFCLKRGSTAVLQQTIINARSEQDEKMSASKVVKFIEMWVFDKESKPSLNDYIGLLMMAYMVNSFWFFQRRVINSLIPEDKKEELDRFIKKCEGKFVPLTQKEQNPDQRLDFYRHEPYIVRCFREWYQKGEGFQRKAINKSVKNKDSKLVLVVNGPMGYNEVAMLLRQNSKLNENGKISIICSKLMSTKVYQKYLLQKYTKLN